MSEKTIGEKLVRTDFNPANSDRVSVLKQKHAELINLVEEMVHESSVLAAANAEEKEKSDFIYWWCTQAKAHLETAAMFAVKAATA